MSSFTLDQDTGDLLVTNNELTLTTGRDAIRQHIQTSLRLFLTEWFLDQTVGVPYYEIVFVKGVPEVVVSSTFKAKIFEVPGVLEILTFNFEYDNATRRANISFRVDTVEGIIDFDEFLEDFLGVE